MAQKHDREIYGAEKRTARRKMCCVYGGAVFKCWGMAKFCRYVMTIMRDLYV